MQPKHERRDNAKRLLVENAKLTTKQKLDKAIARGGSKKEIARLIKLLAK